MKEVGAIFDNDGTLVDTRESVHQSFCYSLSEFGYPIPPRAILAPIIPGPLAVTYRLLCPEGDFEGLKKAYTRFESENYHLIQLYPETLASLERLRRANIPLAVVTSRGTTSVSRLLTDLGIIDFFQIIIGADLVRDPKPHPEGVQMALRHLGASPQNSYMVGDTKHDIDAGRSAGVWTVGLSCGFDGFDITKAEPDFVGEHLGDSADIILAA